MAAAKIITMYSKIYGPNPDFNPKLAAAVTEAKKGGTHQCHDQLSVFNIKSLSPDAN